MLRLGIDMTNVANDTVFGSGQDKVIFNLLQGFSDLGFDKAITVFAYPKLQDAIHRAAPGARIITRNELLPNLLFQNMLSSLFFMPKLLHETEVNALFTPRYSSGLRKYRVPSIVLPHDIQSKTYPDRFGLFTRLKMSTIYSFDFKLRDIIIAISAYDESEIKKHYPRYAHKVKMIYNPIIFPAKIDPEAGYNNQTPYLLSVNIIHKHKNIITLLKAFNLLKHKIPHNLHLVGKTGESTKHLSDYVEDKKLEGRVTFCGYMKEAELNQMLCNCSLYISPSIFEGFGMTQVEAMGAAVPVITTKETALFETTLGQAHYYEPAEDEQALAAKILALLENPPSKEKLEQLSTEIKAKYDYQLISQQYIEMFNSLVR
jgi:glycosyltransferase involved in cell wall biosynthesis